MNIKSKVFELEKRIAAAEVQIESLLPKPAVKPVAKPPIHIPSYPPMPPFPAKVKKYKSSMFSYMAIVVWIVVAALLTAYSVFVHKLSQNDAGSGNCRELYNSSDADCNAGQSGNIVSVCE
jgi:hypothetical protein